MSKKPLNRESLKSLFQNGSRPTESNFGSLIDSMLNKVDDKISKSPEDGLMLAPEGKDTNRLMTFYENIKDNQPQWSIEMSSNSPKGLGIVKNVIEGEKETRMFFARDQKIGIGTTEPRTTFEVNGIFSASSKIGSYKLSSVPADGSWHDLLTGLNGCNAFEIVAMAGKEKSGKYALVHAHALSTFGRSKSKIKKTQAHYGWWWNKIALRWRGSTYDYKLQVKTRSDYGEGQKIRFHITRLWDDKILSLIK